MKTWAYWGKHNKYKTSINKENCLRVDVKRKRYGSVPVESFTENEKEKRIVVTNAALQWQ